MPDFVKKYDYLKSGETLKDVEIRVGVRIMSTRPYGSSLRFYGCKAEGVSIQIMCDSREASNNSSFTEQHDVFRRGDWVRLLAPK